MIANPINPPVTMNIKGPFLSLAGGVSLFHLTSADPFLKLLEHHFIFRVLKTSLAVQNKGENSNG